MRRKNGTPCQRQLSISSLIAANVSVRESAQRPALRDTQGSTGRRCSPCPYCPSTTFFGVIALIDRSAFTFSWRMNSAVIIAGTSMATSATSCVPWFWMMSRTAPACLVVRRASLDPQLLRDRDLHALDMVAIPQRLEHRVREAENEQILNGLFAEVVVDAIDLRLVEVLVDELVQRLGRLQIATERLLDDEARPVFRAVAGAGGAAGRARFAESLDGRRKDVRRQRQVEDAVGRLAAVLLELRDACGERP